ncbi:MAG: acetylglutamate kinase [Dehalococcoidia bacterium]|nr:MAG: acetylglutamate kinase [Dehalococcoidia bacterium]
MARTTVVKIGGSTLGSEDTTLQDIVAMHRAGDRPVVVHGGGAMITDWLKRLDIPSQFVDGLRSTNAEAINVVVGVLRGVVNTQLVGEIVALGGRAVGLCGVDGALVQAERYDERLGFVGRVTGVNAEVLVGLLDSGVIPVIAPIGLEAPSQPLNINADTVAGEVARALKADSLVFLTDVDGLLDSQGALVPELGHALAASMRESGVLGGGMIPKVEACFRAAEAGVAASMANGTVPGMLRRVASGERVGTRIVA